MPTTRIKDLSTTTTSAASDDYVALDGLTNGTRKMLGSKLVAAVASTTDNAIARYDGTAGQVQNSAVTIDDSGNLTVSGTSTSTFAGDVTIDKAAGNATLNVKAPTGQSAAVKYFVNNVAGASSGYNLTGATSKFEIYDEVGGGLAISASSSGVSLRGTTTNDNAATGYVGEYLSSGITVGAAVALTTDVAANITSISLTAGDWDVSGVVFFASSGGTPTARVAATNSTSATNPSDTSGRINYAGAFGSSYGSHSLPLIPARYSLSATTTVYLIATSTFAAGTHTAWGLIQARRVR